MHAVSTRRDASAASPFRKLAQSHAARHVFDMGRNEQLFLWYIWVMLGERQREKAGNGPRIGAERWMAGLIAGRRASPVLSKLYGWKWPWWGAMVGWKVTPNAGLAVITKSENHLSSLTGEVVCIDKNAAKDKRRPTKTRNFLPVCKDSYYSVVTIISSAFRTNGECQGTATDRLREWEARILVLRIAASFPHNELVK
jgi:hypothetical protein